MVNGLEIFVIKTGRTFYSDVRILYLKVFHKELGLYNYEYIEDL